MLTSWQLAASGPGWSVLLKPFLTLRVLIISYPQASVGSSNITLSNKLRTDRVIWSLLMSLNWLRNQGTWELRGLISLPHAPIQRYEKYFLHLIFTFHLNRDASVLDLFPVVVFKKKTFWLLYHHPLGKFRHTVGDRWNRPRRSYINMTLSIIDMDFLYR